MIDYLRWWSSLSPNAQFGVAACGLIAMFAVLGFIIKFVEIIKDIS